MVVVFDGGDSVLKRHERQRRDISRETATTNSGKIRNHPLYIALAAKICRDSFVDYIVAPEEADPQCRYARFARTGDDGTEPPTLVITGDSDLIGYENKNVMIVSSWSKEEYRVFNFEVSHLCGLVANDDLESADHLQSTMAYLQFGPIVFHWHAAVTGCDFTEHDTGLQGIGYKTFAKCLVDLRTSGEQYNNHGALRSAFARLLFETGMCKDKLSINDIVQCLWSIEKCFTRLPIIYNANYRAARLSHVMVPLSEENSFFSKDHAMGQVNPKNGNAFDKNEQELLDAYVVYNALHRSLVMPDQVPGYGLPEGRDSLENCTVQELRAMLNARDGNTVSENGQNMTKNTLLATMKAFIRLEETAPSLVRAYDKDTTSSGTYLKDLDMSNSATMDKHFIQLLDSNFINRPQNRELKKELEVAHKMWQKKEFVEDFEKIALESPELRPELIYKKFGYIGESITQKNIGTALSRVLGMTKLIFHAIAPSTDKKKFYVLSKQEASMCKDDKTRNKVQHGERPEFKQYVVFMVLEVEPTEQKDGHTLGRIVDVKIAYCPYCTAGLGNCYHCVKALWLQYHHWGEGRKTDKPVTMDFCVWLKSTQEAYNSKNAIWEVRPTRLPTSLEEASRRAKNVVYRNCSAGVSSRYDPWGSNPKSAKAKKGDRFCVENNPHMDAFLKALRK
jgi:hypothetical protein